jgi:hypothetical protein
VNTLQRLLAILGVVTEALGTAVGGPIGTGLKFADFFIQIAQHASAAYEAETGQPLDLAKIPREEPLP